MPRIAPGVSHSVYPTADLWNPAGLNPNQIMIKTMEWKESFKPEALPRHMNPSKFHLNKFKNT